MKLSFDFDKIVGKIKPMHAVGQPPISYNGTEGVDDFMFHYLKEANIPYSRLHDTGGFYGGNLFVDVPNIFRDFDADENDPASYDFIMTDILLSKLMKHGVEPYFRLGVTIEAVHAFRPMRIFPPKDNAKWARICEHIIRHYNEGWANGFHFNIKYWEIWNEPDNEESIELNNMWKGTAEQFYDLYAVTSKHLRECFGTTIKIGGYSSTGLYLGYLEKMKEFNEPHELSIWDIRAIYHTKFFIGFLERVKKDNLPLDFFSHHTYVDVGLTGDVELYTEKILEEYGLGDIEIHINEWNTDSTLDTRGTTKSSADVAAMMMAMHDKKITMMCYYDARLGHSVYAGLFNPLTYKPFCTYYSFKAFGNLYALENQAEVTGDITAGLYALAATNGKERGILITNIGEDKDVETNLDSSYTVYAIDEKHFMTKKRLNLKSFKLKKYETIYVEKK